MNDVIIDNSILRRLQDTELEIMTVLDNFCTENGIKYSLYAGTAIGAVRHKGFIPWDDDVDIVMTRGEYNKFVKIISENPIEGYSMVCPELDENCSISHAKLIKNGTILLAQGEYEDIGNHGIWVDIFPLDKVTEETKNTIFSIGKKIILFTRARTKNKNDNTKKRIIRFVFKLIPQNVVQRKLRYYLNELDRNNRLIQTDYKWTELAATYTFKYLFDPEMMDNFHRIEFEGHKFLIVDDYDAMLRQLYGDYMKLPPESERRIKHHPVKIVF